MRTGLHSGEVVVRTIGNDLTMDYDQDRWSSKSYYMRVRIDPL